MFDFKTDLDNNSIRAEIYAQKNFQGDVEIRAKVKGSDYVLLWIRRNGNIVLNLDNEETLKYTGFKF